MPRLDGDEAFHFLPLLLLSPNQPSSPTMASPLLLLTLTLSLLSLSLLLFSLHRRLRKPDAHDSNDPNSTLTHSLLLEILPSNLNADRADSGGEDRAKRKKKRRPKRKKPRVGDGGEKEGLGLKEKQELVCLYPFTSSSSATQRKIKQQYDQLVKSHESNGLTLAQVGEFVNCLIEARNELQHKSDVIQRKFTITKALLLKADRSSFDRLRQQIYKLELEQKRLEEDAFVYNWLQQQLKLSPAYKKMLEISVSMELKAKSRELSESADADQFKDDISFEELLAREKKDSFWQKNRKPRPCSG
ncbi:uncharacterized protein LOC127795067 [Diospyros lotus]|uniref:uncharacterized protein LOC127795067 n=1 Tax=Diospyros lotus TaxID=55363 RepID=UPI002259CEC8|nr:uncharacterized protein LOC127795067 [Diospyros lotus]